MKRQIISPMCFVIVALIAMHSLSAGGGNSMRRDRRPLNDALPKFACCAAPRPTNCTHRWPLPSQRRTTEDAAM